MADTIKTGTTLIEDGAFSPEYPRLESDPDSNGRMSVKHPDGSGLDQKIRQARESLLCLAARQQISCLLLVCLTAVVASASAQTERPTVEAIIARMAQARAENRSLLRPYIVTRDYKLFGKETHKSKSQVIADVTFVPPDLKKYAIQQTNGTGLGERIVRRALETEAEVARDYSSTDISLDNYDFRVVGEEDMSGQRCYVLELLPRRKVKNLLRGSIWVDANTYLLHRAEGEPAKNPSWWLHDVRIALSYGDVAGMWLATSSEATANVRILGKHTMVSRDVKYNISELVAAGSSTEQAYESICLTDLFDTVGSKLIDVLRLSGRNNRHGTRQGF